MSKKFKRVIGVIAAIAIPFAAPAIAASLGVSAAVGSALGVGATAASTIGAGLTGAVLGAGNAALTGQDVGRGALFGGVGGGIGGYTTAAQAARAAQAAQAAGGTGAGAGGIEAVNAGQSLSSMAGTTPTIASQAGGMGAALGTTPTAGFAAPLTVGGFAQPSAVASQVAGLSTAPAAAAASGGSGFTQALVNRFKDPKALADLTLRAAGQLAGSALSDSGLSPEERGLLSAQTEELRNLQQTNRSAFNTRMQQAMNLIGESRYFDPEYFGLQAATREQIRAGRAKQAGLRGLGGERRAAAARKFDVEAGKDVASAFSAGYGQGVSGRLQTLQAGISAIPTEYSGAGLGGYGGLMDAYGNSYNRRRQQQIDIGNLFGSFTGGNKARQTGDEEEEKT
jgi:hypothetical protein